VPTHFDETPLFWQIDSLKHFYLSTEYDEPTVMNENVIHTLKHMIIINIIVIIFVVIIVVVFIIANFICYYCYY